MSIAHTRLLGPSEPLLMKGNFSAPIDDRRLDVFSPPTEEPMAQVAVGGEPNIGAAVTAARLAFDESPWFRLRVAERAQLLISKETALGGADEGHAALSDISVSRFVTTAF